MTGIVPAYKLECEGLQVEFEVVSPIELVGGHSGERQALALDIQDLDKQIDACEEELKKLPKVDSTVSTKDGKGYVSEVSPLTGIVRVKFADNDNIIFRSYPAEDVKVIAPPKKGSKNHRSEEETEENEE